ncbi:MAG: hypothetical protein NXI12_15300, partial [Alphaproteobacteria bacterium]|nr:hypothetical protein [Alphaproteobacteria bacterium]
MPQAKGLGVWLLWACTRKLDAEEALAAAALALSLEAGVAVGDDAGGPRVGRRAAGTQAEVLSLGNVIHAIGRAHVLDGLV